MNVVQYCVVVGVAVVAMWVGGCDAIRVDDKEGFALCNVPQAAVLEKVEVRECSRWPCLARAGRKGTYQITFTPQTNTPMNNIRSDIYAWVKLPFVPNRRGPIRVPMPREINQPLCQYLTPGCPVQPGVTTTIKKSVTIPVQARMAQGNVVVEVSVKDDQNRILTCFHAPVIVA